MPEHDGAHCPRDQADDDPVVAKLIPWEVNDGIQQAGGLFDFLEQASVAIVGS